MTLLDALTSQPITKRALASKLDTDTRSVELAINAARRGGAPICSSSDGYFLGDAEAVEECARRLRNRLRSQYATVRAMRLTARRLRGYRQTALPWDVAA